VPILLEGIPFGVSFFAKLYLGKVNFLTEGLEGWETIWRLPIGFEGYSHTEGKDWKKG